MSVEGFSGRAGTGPRVTSVERQRLRQGSKEDFLIHVAVPDNNSLYALVIDRLTERAEVADVRTSVVYEHLRNTRIAPAD